MPTGGVVISGASERPSAKDEKITAALQIGEDGGPCDFGDNGALREDQKASLRVGELRRQLFCRSETRFRKGLGKLR